MSVVVSQVVLLFLVSLDSMLLAVWAMEGETKEGRKRRIFSAF